MSYEAFKSAFQAALQESGLPTLGFVTEKLDLNDLDRIYEVGVEPIGGQDVEPFFVSGKVWWRWAALHTARTATREEDMLMQLFGGAQDAYEMQTERSLVRVDIEMQTNLPWGKAIPMPTPAIWAKWAHEVMTRLETVERVVQEDTTRETDDGMLEILAWQGNPVAKVAIARGGELKLESIKVSAFQSPACAPRAARQQGGYRGHPGPRATTS